MDKSIMIPLPPDFVTSDFGGGSRPTVALYPCLNSGDCKEWRLVKLDSKRKPYAACSPKDVTIAGCSRRSYGLQGDIPVQTYEAYQSQLKKLSEVKPIPETYLKFLEKAWAGHATEPLEPETVEPVEEQVHEPL